jgi:hypothetical protein
MPGFLEDPRLGARGPRTVRDVGTEGLDARAAVGRLGDGGADEDDSAERGAAVAELRGMRPGAFLGFGSPREDEDFDAWFNTFLGWV